MAENTFTVDTSPQTETLTDNLTPDEQDSLKVGEEIVDQQEQLLAGKYKTAQDLEKAYKELESKLGEQSGQENVEQTSAEDETEETSLSDGATLIASANDEFYENDGKLSPDADEHFRLLKEVGAFSGDTIMVEGIWSTPTSEGPRYYRSTTTSVRDDLNDVCLYSNHQPVEADVYETAVRENRVFRLISR